MTKLLVTLSLIFFICLIEGRIQKRHSENTLELIHVIFRHGDRTPDKKVVYKNDPFINETYYPFGYGQLTNEGKRKEYGIGKALRRKYSQFLGDFTLDIVDSRCTDYNRTKTSLQLVLASLFPPRGKNVWEKKLNWQPVPFNYWPEDEDHVLGDPHANCPVFQEAYLNFLNSSEGRELYENFTEIIKHLELKTGQRLYSKSFAELYFTLTTEEKHIPGLCVAKSRLAPRLGNLHNRPGMLGFSYMSEFGLKIPQWSKDAYPHIKQLAILDYTTSTFTNLQKRLSTGFLIKKIIDDSIAKSKAKEYDATKIFLYSAHESNIAAVLRFLGIFYDHIPPYGSYVTFEIHNIKGVRVIKVYYQDYSSGKPKKYKIPKCGNFCTLEKFKSLHKHLLPESEEECFVAAESK